MGEGMQNNEPKKYEFIKEKRKEVPVNKKKVAIQAGYVAVLALLFGVIASFVIAFLQPKLAEMFYPKEDEYVSIPEDEPTETEIPTDTQAPATTEVENKEEPMDMIFWQSPTTDYIITKILHLIRVLQLFPA